jgi:hypothetical protein
MAYKTPISMMPY